MEEEKKQKGGNRFRKACKRVVALFAALSAIFTFAGNLGPLCTKFGDDMFDAYHYGAAYRLYEAGAKMDNPDCEIRLAYMLRKGIYVEKDKSQAKYYEAQAHNHGLEIVPTMRPTPTAAPVKESASSSPAREELEPREIQEAEKETEKSKDKETGKSESKSEEESSAGLIEAKNEEKKTDQAAAENATQAPTLGGAALFSFFFLQHTITIPVPFLGLELSIPLPYLICGAIFLLGVLKIDKLSEAEPTGGKIAFEVLVCLSTLYCILFFLLFVPLKVVKYLFVALFVFWLLVLLSALRGDVAGYLERKKEGS